MTDEPVVEPWWLDDNMAYSASDDVARVDPAVVASEFERLAQELDLHPNYGRHAKRD